MMKQDEKRYSMKRVSDVQNIKSKELQEKYTTKKKEITNAQKIKAIRDGICIIDDTYGARRKLTLLTTLEKAVDFSDIEHEDSFDKKSYNKEYKKVRTQANTVQDAIMSEDADQARKLMKEFCKGY